MKKIIHIIALLVFAFSAFSAQAQSKAMADYWKDTDFSDTTLISSKSFSDQLIVFFYSFTDGDEQHFDSLSIAGLEFVLNKAKVNYRSTRNIILFNNAFFQTRYAWWNGETKHGPLTAYGNFISQTYPSKDDLTFPAQEAFFLHYKVKDVAIEGNYTLNSKGEYTITTYDKDGTVLDTKTHAWNLEQGGVATAVDLDIAQATAYVELLVSIDKDGIITFTDNSMKEDESQSGIVW